MMMSPAGDMSVLKGIDYDKAAKASVQVKTGDTIEIQFGSRNVKVEVLDVKETVKKEEVENLYRYI